MNSNIALTLTKKNVMKHNTKRLNHYIPNKFTHFASCFLTGVFLWITTNSFASENDLSKYFGNKSGCFILYDLTHNKVLEHYNSIQCAKRISTHSTFKIALSLMAFDQHLINQKTSFKWDGKRRLLPQWNNDQTPKTWIQHSVVWVSQRLTPQLGLQKINTYLKDFHYGNCDFSGHPGKSDGLTQAWLSCSLKISANEQLKFLTGLVAEKLPVSKLAMKNTKDNMFIQGFHDGAKLYGKTGSGHGPNLKQQEGWFVGFIQKQNQQYIVVANVTYDKRSSNESGGHVAKIITINILNQKHLLSFQP